MPKRVVVSTLVCCVLLTGCSNTDELEKGILEYNKSTEKVLSDYKEIKPVAEKDKDAILKTVVEDTIDISKYNLEALSEDDKNNFKSIMINEDNYYTSIESEVLNEVILLIGDDGRKMSIDIEWSKSGVIDIDRKIVG